MRRWATLLPLLLLSMPAYAVTHRVPADYPTIQEALDVSAAGDTVLVAPGTYLDNTIVDGLPTMAALPEGVTLRSEGGPGVTILDMSEMMVWSAGRGIVCHASAGNENVIEGFTITGHPADTYGFWFYQGARVVVRDCVVDPGVPADPLVDRRGMTSSAAELTVTGCAFRRCSADGAGAAIRLGLGDVVIEDCEVLACTDESVRYWGPSSVPYTLAIRNTSFDDITGTAIRCRNVEGGVTIDGCRFDIVSPSNVIQLDGYGADVVANCTFRGLEATAGVGRCISDYRGSLELRGNTMTDLDEVYGTATVLSTYNVDVVIEGNVVANTTGDSAFDLYGGELVGSGCNIYWNNDDLGIPLGPTDFVVDPMICDPDSGLPYVAENSPCLPENHPGDCPDRIGALGALCAGDGSTPFGVRSTPLGPTVAIDGTAELAPAVYSLPPGTHVVSADPVQELPSGLRYLFQSWSDGGAATHDVVVPSIYAEVTADFDTEYLLEAIIEGEGSVPNAGWKAPGEVASITAVPDSGWSFHIWVGTGDGAYSGFDNPATVTMNEPLQQRALFWPDQYLLTTIAGEGGTVTPPTGPQDRGSYVQVEAIPDPGWAFLTWTGQGVISYNGPDNPANVRMDGPITQTATFIDAFPILTMIATEGGTVTPETGPQPVFSYPPIEAIPDSGYVFVGWIGEGEGSYTGTVNPHGVHMLGAITQTAVFEPDGLPPLHLLEMEAGEGGSVTPETAHFSEGTSVVIRATASPGYVFRDWKGQGPGSYTGTENPETVTVQGPITQLAQFDPISYEVTLSLSDTDPQVHAGAPIGFGEVYLWLVCGSADGITALSADVEGTLDVVTFSPEPGVLNAGTAGHLDLSLFSCATGPTLLGEFLVLPPGEGRLCIDLAAPFPQLAVHDCRTPAAQVDWPRDVQFTGVRTDGGIPCVMGRGCDDPLPANGVVAAPLPPAEPVTCEDRFEGVMPNPSASATSLRFSLAAPARVRLSIYDVAGRLVRTLLDEERPAGTHDVSWAGADASGRVAPAGIYLAKLEAGGLQETRKLVRLAPR